MATLNEISYMILETIRNNNIVDDEDLDPRLIQDWVNLKREQFIKSSRNNNPNNKTDLNLSQTESVTLEVVTATNVGDYPYSTAKEDAKIVASIDDIPYIVEDKSGPIILSIESEDLVKYPFAIVPYDQLRFSGNGRFNSNLIFGSIRDNKVYFKYNEFFDTYTTINLRAVFKDPREVTGFTDESEYPANLALLEAVKNAILDKDIRMLFQGREDTINNATNDV